MLKLNSWTIAIVLWMFCLAASIPSSAQTFKTIANFAFTNGTNPYSWLVQGTDGNFYGTTYQGGSSEYYGEVFKVSPQGTITVLHNFEGSDGGFPYAGVIQGTDGNFYGTTSGGGTGTSCTESTGCGTVFKITISGGVATLSTLYDFCSKADCTDGMYPDAGLVEGTDGNYYGSTTAGGAGNNCTALQPAGCGTIFKITPAGTLTTLHVFNFSDGYQPWSTLIQGTDGNFYGTTAEGVAYGDICGFGCGTIFKMTPSGTLTTLHIFDGPDGAFPQGALLQDSTGNFVGTTTAGGAYDDCGPTEFWCGTIFQITSAGTFTSLFSFDGGDGAQPTAGLVQATDGNFYGTTDAGGTSTACIIGGCGTAFKITPANVLTTLYNFCSQTNCTDGAQPAGGVFQATNGAFYGMGFFGGIFGSGTVFSLSEGLKPFVETRPTSGKTGTKVTILGNNLKGATSVAFNGVTATIMSDSNSEITTTVPTGATTGYVKVTTPGGTLTSNVKFRVP